MNKSWSILVFVFVIAIDGAICIKASTKVPSHATPLILHLYPQNQQVKVGEAATWYLTAAGVEPLEFQWKLNGKEIPGAKTNTLRIVKVRPSDQGLYTCFLKNEAGTIETDAVSLTVLSGADLSTTQKIEKTSTPVNSTVKSKSSDQP